jgi:PAS domain S-box-containing protein
MNADAYLPRQSEAFDTSETSGSFDDALFAALMADSPIGIAWFDTGLRLRRVNRAMLRVLRLHSDGLAEEYFVGRRLVDLLEGDFAVALEGSLLTALEEDLPRLCVNVDLRQRGLDCSFLPLHGADGVLLGVALTVVDDNGRQVKAESLARSAQRYRSVVESTSQILWVTGPDGGVTEDAPRWREFTGQTEGEYLAEGWLAAVHPDDRVGAETAWRTCLRNGGALAAELRIRTRLGGWRQFTLHATPIRHAGEVVEWVGVNLDVTGRREAEEMRGRLTEQLSAAALRTARLQQATSMLAEALTVNQVVLVITEVGRSAIGADHSAVALLDDDKLRLRIVTPAPDGEGEAAPWTGPAAIPLSVPSVMSVAVRENRPFLAVDSADLLRQLGREEPEVFAQGTGERAWVGLPLAAAGAPLGALRFSFDRPREITEEERVFLEALAGQCALAMERALLFEREHSTAENLQRSLLPSELPDLPAVRLAARYNPVTRHVQVGGDWYDVFRLPDDRVAIVIGDVMGKGVLAAAVMGRVRNALRALALTDPRPAAVLSGLDRLFTAAEDLEQFTTLAYLVIDPTSGEGDYGNAGHPPPLVLGHAAPPRLSGIEPGTPLGWASHRQQTRFTLTGGDTIVLYSDGLVENRRRGVDTGLEELVAAAAGLPPNITADPERLVDHLVDRMLTGYEQSDDVTILAVHAVPRGS